MIKNKASLFIVGIAIGLLIAYIPNMLKTKSNESIIELKDSSIYVMEHEIKKEKEIIYKIDSIITNTSKGTDSVYKDIQILLKEDSLDYELIDEALNSIK
jgi:hypothetical protein